MFFRILIIQNNHGWKTSRFHTSGQYAVKLSNVSPYIQQVAHEVCSPPLYLKADILFAESNHLIRRKELIKKIHLLSHS
jgi:hypothetical protein